MKTYLITGAAGFIGANFIKYMLAKYPEIKIVVLDLLTYAGNLGTIAEDIDGERCEFVKGNICDRALTDELFAKYQFDYVVNFAAESHVDRSIENPQLFLVTNILGTQNLLDSARKAWVTGKAATGYPEWREGVRFHQVSTDEVYGSLGAEGYFHETTPLDPRSPYSASKTSADLFVQAYSEPYYFNLNGQAGAPPDDFSVNGQNWGFPTYNWDVMEKDGYRWWMKRFQKMSEYFDAYRIDHILGFFRIWEIPMHAVHGLLGQFIPSIPMSREEIESYGLPFREEYLIPYIHESFLGQVFGPHTDYVKQTFLLPAETPGVYHMKPEFTTQREVESFFAGKNDENSLWIRDGLYTLISDVLFVPDTKEKDKYHPRIGIQRDFIFRSLNEQEQNAFNRLYDQYYYHRHNEFWRQQAMKKLPQLTQSTRMLVCGEDLGMIPDCVSSVMNDLRILSLEIQRMPKNPMHEFGYLNEYPYRSVCTISTHDMSTLRGWWEEDYLQTQRYYNTMLGHYGTAPTVATPELCEEVVRNHLKSNSILCILSLQDWLSIDGKWRNPNVQEERINVPSNPRNYWRYRMHLTLEQLMKAEELNDKIRELIKYTGRAPKK